MRLVVRAAEQQLSLDEKGSSRRREVKLAGHKRVAESEAGDVGGARKKQKITGTEKSHKKKGPVAEKASVSRPHPWIR